MKHLTLGVIGGMLIAGLALAAPAQAQTYPTKSIKIVVPFPPGGASDIFARLIAQKLTQSLGQQVVVDNRPGAGGNIGADIVAKAEPDGYTLLEGTVSTHAINPSLYTRMPYDAVRDFEPVAFVAGVANVMEVNPKNVKATTVAEFIAEAKAAPRKFTFVSGGNGTSFHVSAELFKHKTGVDMVHVPYRGSVPALNDLIAGEADVMFDNISSSIQHIRAGSLRALAVTSAERSPLLPQVPTLMEAGVPEFEATSWYAMFAPAKTPRVIVDRLNAEIRKALEDPDVQKRFAELAGNIRPMSPADLGAFQRAEMEKWAEVVKLSGAKVE